MGTPYPSGISREQFESLRELLEQARKKTKPRPVGLYEVFCTILYGLKSGCQWRMLPRGFPKWQLVYKYFRQWNTKPSENVPSLLGQALKNAVAQVRTQCGRAGKTAFVVLDAQGVKDTDTAGEKGYGAGKKVSGIKRHIAVDTQGLPHAVAVAAADRADREGALMACRFHETALPEVNNGLAGGDIQASLLLAQYTTCWGQR